VLYAAGIIYGGYLYAFTSQALYQFYGLSILVFVITSATTLIVTIGTSYHYILVKFYSQPKEKYIENTKDSASPKASDPRANLLY